MMRGLRWAMLLALTLTVLFSPRGAHAQASPQRSAFGEQWVATDALGRALPLATEVATPRADRYVGVFYWLWHGYTRTTPIRDVTQTLLANPNNPTWHFQDYFWGQPEAGYYHSSDPWVARRNLQMLADAGIDFIFFDFTNGPIGKESFDSFMGVAEDMRAAGIPVPYFVFFLNSAGADTLNWLYQNVYQPGKYQDLWFRWQGKPLLMADPAFAATPAIADFFTFRLTWAFQAGQEDQWRFIDDFPQRASWHTAPDKPEEICVSKSMGAPLVPVAGIDNKGSSFHGGMAPSYDAQWLSADTPKGLFFDEQWQRALQVDPEIVLVSGWNELTAGAWNADSGMAGQYSFMGNKLQTGGWYFVDEFNEEFNRDLEPMTGGYTDDYYYQLVSYVRRFKGMHPRDPVSPPATPQIDGSFSEWQTVLPVFHDPAGDTAHRDFQNTDGSAQLKNDTGRNDIVESRVTHDETGLFFYAKTAAPLSPPSDSNWMLLFIDTDQNKATGFQGYDYLVGAGGVSSGKTPLARWDGKTWQPAGSARLASNGAELELRIDKALLHAGDAPSIDFHWADNIRSLTDVSEFFVNGDSAPDRRFDFRYLGLSAGAGSAGSANAAGSAGAGGGSGAATGLGGSAGVAGSPGAAGGAVGNARASAPPARANDAGASSASVPPAPASCACSVRSARNVQQAALWLALSLVGVCGARRRKRSLDREAKPSIRRRQHREARRVRQQHEQISGDPSNGTRKSSH
jgi:hypothetical protein